MSDTTIFYLLGAALVVAALVVSALGLRDEKFPSRNALRGLIAFFAVLVLSTMTFSVLNSRAEHEKTEENSEAAHRLNEVDLTRGVQAADAPEGEAGAGDPGAEAQATPNQEAAPAAPAQTLALSSPATGELVFDPTTLSTTAGAVAIDYENPSPVPHSVAIEDAAGETIGSSEVGADGTFSVTAELEAGEYVYYCTVPGHREAGMAGMLSIQ